MPAPTTEHRFSERRFRFDYAWVEQKVAVEQEGIFYNARISRHQTGAGYAKDCEKYNLAMVLGWRVLRYTPAQIKTQNAINQIKCLLEEYT